MNTNYIFYIYGSYLSASPSLSLSLNEIEVDNICFQHKGRNSQEQYLLSMKLTSYGLVILLQEQIPNISYSWFVRIVSFLSLTYLLFFSLIGQNSKPTSRILALWIGFFVFTSLSSSSSPLSFPLLYKQATPQSIALLLTVARISSWQGHLMLYVNHVKAPMEPVQPIVMVISFAFVMERSICITVMVQLSIIGSC